MVKIVHRRHVLSLLAGAAMARAVGRPPRDPFVGGTIVIVDGWVLREDDLGKIAAHAA